MIRRAIRPSSGGTHFPLGARSALSLSPAPSIASRFRQMEAGEVKLFSSRRQGRSISAFRNPGKLATALAQECRDRSTGPSLYRRTCLRLVAIAACRLLLSEGCGPIRQGCNFRKRFHFEHSKALIYGCTVPC